jgi:protein ImuA
MIPAATLQALRDTVTRIERGTPRHADVLPFACPPIDDALPGGGLPMAALHEVAGEGMDLDLAAAPALFAAGILARRPGPVLWVLERRDLFAPGLAAAGLGAERVIYAEAGPKHALAAMEEGLRHRGLAGVVAEVSGRITLTVSRRLHLAAQAGGATALLLRRRAAEGAMAAATRWRIGPMPSAPPIPGAPDVPGLGRARWRLDLLRCRGGRTGSWVVEACDAAGGLGLVSVLGDGSAASRRDAA